MKKEIFKGVGTALVTPFKNGQVDYTSLEILLEKQLNANVSAVIVLGTTGEPATLSMDERDKIIRTAKRIVADKAKLIVGCGSNSTGKTIELYKQAESLGADGALIVTPYYNKCTQGGLIEHYKAVGKSGNLPIIVYNVPARTGVNILAETMRELCKIKNVCGIKEASGDIHQILDIFRLCGKKVAIYSGEDSLNAIFIAMGASGTISVASNVFPSICKKIVDLGMAKQYERMFILQQQIQPFIKSLFLEVNPICVKGGLWYLGLCKNQLRLPLTPISNNDFEILKNEINNLIGLEYDCM